MKKALSMILALLMIACVFAGCAPADTGSSTPDTTPVVGDVNSETPMYMQWYQGIGVETVFESPFISINSLYPYMVFDRLSEVNTKTGERYWCLAEKMELSEDLKVVTITVRQGAKWHDGKPVTVDDVVFSIYAAICDPQSGQKGNYEGIIGAAAVMDGTADTMEGLKVEGNVITLTYENACATLLNDIGNLTIFPKHCFPEDVDFATFNSYDYWKKPIGSGPYKITEVVFPDYFKVTRFDDYWGAKPGIKNVVFTHYGSNDSGIAAVINSEIDFGTRQLIADGETAKNIINQNASVKSITTAGYYYRSFRFMLNERPDGKTKALLKDKEVRLAMDLLIDNDGMASVYGDLAEGIDVLFSPGDPNYPTHLQRESQNVDKALEILNRKGWNFEDEINICYYHGDQTTHDLMQFVKQGFEKAGLKCTVYYAQTPAADPTYLSSNYDMLYIGGNAAADYPAIRYLYMQSSQLATMWPADERKERGYDDIYTLYDSNVGEKRIEYAHKLMEMNFEDNYELPCFTVNNTVVYNTAKILVPEVVFQVEATTHMEWENWRVLN